MLFLQVGARVGWNRAKPLPFSQPAEKYQLAQNSQCGTRILIMHESVMRKGLTLSSPISHPITRSLHYASFIIALASLSVITLLCAFFAC
jgi:hypothetical protein